MNILYAFCLLFLGCVMGGAIVEHDYNKHGDIPPMVAGSAQHLKPMALGGGLYSVRSDYEHTTCVVNADLSFVKCGKDQ